MHRYLSRSYIVLFAIICEKLGVKLTFYVLINAHNLVDVFSAFIKAALFEDFDVKISFM